MCINHSDLALKVMVVEDNLSDFKLLKIACQSLAFQVDLIHFENGIDMFSHLRDRPEEKPSFFLIDLKNPVMDGKDILKKLSRSPTLSYVPSIIFSISNNEDDIKECTELGANAYVQKPDDFETFERVIENIFGFCRRLNVDKIIEKDDNFEHGGAIRGVWNIFAWGSCLTLAVYLINGGQPLMAIIPLVIGAFLTMSRE